MAEEMSEEMAGLVNTILEQESFRDTVQKYVENMPQKDFSDMVNKTVKSALEEAVQRQMQAIVAQSAATVLPQFLSGDALKIALKNPGKPPAGDEKG